MTIGKSIPVLDKGYLRLNAVYGDELSIINAARVSYDKESRLEIFCEDCGAIGKSLAQPCPGCGDWDTMSRRLSQADAKLIKYLCLHGHTSPLRHVTLAWEVKAPLMVAREWWKHVVGAASIEEGTNWNEESRRYVDSKPEFYFPEAFRTRDPKNKQGSGPPLEPHLQNDLARHLADMHLAGAARYQQALDAGVAPELARLFLPAYGLYTRWRWTASLQATLHCISLRDAPGAQWEITQYAAAMKNLAAPHFPTVFAFYDSQEETTRP